MATIYISSTYKDLVGERDKVYRALRQLRHDVIAMEDYLAADERPLDKCLADVERSDVYVGLIAWRYGHIPEQNNPLNKSITELEFRKARERGKECKVFLLDPKAPWVPDFFDSQTEEGEGGKRIKDFRQELQNSVTVSFFKNADDLAGLVSRAVALWEKERQPKPEPSPYLEEGGSKRGPQFRDVNTAGLLAHSPLDQELAEAWADLLRARDLSCHRSSQVLFAERDVEIQEQEKKIVQCHTAGVILSPASLGQLKSRTASVKRVIDLMRFRTGYVAGLLSGVKGGDLPPDWVFSEVFELPAGKPSAGQGAESWFRRMESQGPAGEIRTVGLPLIILAMIRSEVEDLEKNPDLLQKRLGTTTFEQFQALTQELAKNGILWKKRYEGNRESWRPFDAKGEPIRRIVENIVDELNQKELPRLRQRHIKIQSYPFEAIKEKDPLLRRVYREVAQTGCVLIVDELSLFHPDLREAFNQSPFFNCDQAAMVTLCPFDPGETMANRLLESETRQKLATAFDRFAFDFDPQFEFAVGDERRLKRWLYASLPETLRNLREPRPDPGALKQFANEIGGERLRKGVREYIWSGGESR
jgi:hypothetical protein